MSEAKEVQPTPADEAFSLERGPLIFSGVVALLAGTAAIIFPIAATLGVALVAGAALIVLGIAELVRAFRMRRTGRIIATVAFGLLAIVTGALFLLSPLAAMLSLTFLLIAYFAAGGVCRLISAWRYPVGSGRIMMLLSGGLSVILALVLLFALPSAAAWALGLLFGIDSIFFGAALLALATRRRQDDDRHAGRAPGDSASASAG